MGGAYREEARGRGRFCSTHASRGHSNTHSLPLQEAERQKNIEEEQQKFLQEQLEQQREKALKKKADDEQFQLQLQDSLDAEAAKWDERGKATT